MKKLVYALAILLIPACFFAAGSSSSTNYAIQAQITDGGGLYATTVSNNYAIQSSVSGIGEVTSGGNPQYVARGGYPGQLYEIDSVVITADVNPVNEDSTTQLSAVVHLDDATEIHPANDDVAWAIDSGPIASISATGLVTPEPVIATTGALADGTYAGTTGQVSITVEDNLPDNYLSYGGDGIDDAWQYLYFGLPPNADAGPLQNPDFDPDSNMMEFLTGFDPTDPTSWFKFTISGKSGDTAHLLLNKVIPGSTYTIYRGTDLETFPTTVTTIDPSTEALDYTYDDTGASDPKVFYRVDVTR